MAEPIGIPRLLQLLSDGLQESERHAIERGTQHVEIEYQFIAQLRESARMFGGDVTDAQWYAGIATILSVLAGYSAGGGLAGMFLDPITGITSHALARLHDDIVREGVVVFDE